MLSERFERIEEKWHLSIEKSRIKSVSYCVEKGRAVRVIEDGKVGFAASSGTFDFEKLEKLALELSKISGEKMDDFPSFNKFKNPKIYDKKIEDFDVRELKNMGETIIESLRKGNLSTGVVEIERITTKIENPEFSGSYSETLAFSFIEVVKSGSAYNYTQSRNLDIYEKLKNIVEEAENLAEKPTNSVSRDVTVVLSPIAFNQLVSYALFPSFSAENVVKGRSPINVGKCFEWEFKLIDNPLLNWGLNSRPFDDEGVSSERKVLYSDKVESLLSDWRFSKITNEKAGNAVRREITSYPTISTSNIILDVKIRESIDYESLYVHTLTGAHTTNPVSGDFSVECSNAMYKDKFVKVMLYGNIYESLKKLESQTKPIQVDSTVCGKVLFDVGAFKLI